MAKSTTRAKRSGSRGKGRSASSKAGDYVHEEIKHVRERKHGAANPKQAIAIGLSKARRAGVRVPKPKRRS